ncbi:MAG: diphthine--ammonia ligase [Candidatus Bathyarchaeota archaeon]|nr:diphthine--ammonia ligase [Candidatus Bathyarchaeota archaeon]
MKVVVSWSGGKDSCFALYKALEDGLEVVSLLTFMKSDEQSNFHGINAKILDEQALSLGFPLAKCVTTPEGYEEQFKEALSGFKEKGAEGLVTGDIYEVSGHEERWLERMCREVDLKPIRPLWQADTKQLFKEFIDAGFNATVVRTNPKALTTDWLGRQLNNQFLEDILKLDNVDPCGEGGEYHTVMTDGPNFKNRINLIDTKKQTVDGFGRLEIMGFTVTPKQGQQ